MLDSRAFCKEQWAKRFMDIYHTVWLQLLLLRVEQLGWAFQFGKMSLIWNISVSLKMHINLRDTKSKTKSSSFLSCLVYPSSLFWLLRHSSCSDRNQNPQRPTCWGVSTKSGFGAKNGRSSLTQPSRPTHRTQNAVTTSRWKHASCPKSKKSWENLS